MNLSDEVQTPLLKRCRSYYGLQWQRFELLLSRELLTFGASSDFPANIDEQCGPIIPCSEYLVGCGLPEMMTSTKATMKIKHNLLGLLWVQASQKYP